MKLINQYRIRQRLLVSLILVAFIYVVLLSRIFYLQIIDGVNLQAKALDQWTRDVPLVATRGKINDSNGIVLADTTTQYTLYLRPNSVNDLEYTARALCDVFNYNYDTLYAKISKKGVSEVTVARGVTKEQMLALVQRDCVGLYFSQDIKRYYPYGDFMTQLLGFTNIDGVGQSGIESYYNKYLQGVNGYQLIKTDLVGRELENDVYYVPSITGLNVNLTIDYYIQSLAEKSVKDAMQKYSAKSASCIVINPQTGAVKAIAQAPSFDLNNIPRDNVVELFSQMKCSLISNVYEPGSTFKIVTAAIGLETNKFNSSYQLFCPGYRVIDGQRIKCWRTIGHGSLDFAGGIAKSCNCLFMDIATTVGVETTYDYYEKIGLNRITGIDMLGEASGLLIKEENVKTVDIARMGFGQAIAITPIELITAASCVVNGGYLIKPYLLESVTDGNGDIVIPSSSYSGEQVFSLSTSAQMREFLGLVVSEGSGSKASVPGYTVGGKTGTAQKYENGTIAQGKYVSSFLGFTSLENPEYMCLMIVDEPQGYLYYGSLVAAPYVGDIFTNIMAYKGIAPSMPISEKPSFIMPDLVGMSTTDATVILKQMGITYEIEGSGTVTYQFPSPLADCDGNTVAFIRLE